MSLREWSGNNWSRGVAGADVGTQEWADSVRLSLIVKVEKIGEQDAEFLRHLEFMEERKIWPLLTKKDGSRFRSLEEFCVYKRPWGLGRPLAWFLPYIRAAMAKRGLTENAIERRLACAAVPVATPHLEQLSVARQARNEKTQEVLEGTACPPEKHEEFTVEPAERTAKQIRAITRNETAQEAYQSGKLSAPIAAKLGKKAVSEAERARLEAIAAEALSAPDQRAGDALVRERLGIPAPTALDKLRKLVRKLSDAELDEARAAIATELERREERRQHFARKEASPAHLTLVGTG